MFSKNNPSTQVPQISHLNKRILIVEDEDDLAELIALSLKRIGFTVERAENVTKAKKILQNARFDLIITDMRLGDGLGLEVIALAQKLNIKSMMMTAYASTQEAVEALKLGAIDYLIKPVSLEKIKQKVLEIFAADIELNINENINLNIDKNNKNIENPKNIYKNKQEIIIQNLLIGETPAMQALKKNILQYAQNNAPIMVLGQTGTGKERVAQALHLVSNRAAGAFVAINCASIPEALLESELFGYRRGAFSGAQEAKIGLIQSADKGTLFLDEIAEMPLNLQAKLLRVLQEKQIRALGDTKETAVDIKIICATHQDLSKQIANGLFREDLYYRINVLSICLPSLKERAADIALLAGYFLKKIIASNEIERGNIEANKTLAAFCKDHFLEKIFSKDAMLALENFDFPGNVRQLENILQVAYLNAKIQLNLNLDLNTNININSNINSNQSLNLLTFLEALKIEYQHLPEMLKNFYLKNNADNILNNSENNLQNNSLNNINNVENNVENNIEIKLAVKLPIDLPAHIIEIEKKYIDAAILQYGQNQSAIAKALGLSLRQLRYRLEQYEYLNNINNI